MKKTTLTEEKAEKTPTGGVLVGKRQGQTIIHNKGTLSGYLVGRTHDKGGIKAVNKSTGQALEMQGGEVVITAPAVSDNTKRNFNGKMMTNREILSEINVKGGGVAFAKGGDIPKKIKRTGASYKYGGKTMTDHEIYKKITQGHLAEGMTLSQIAKKHKVSLKELQKQVDMGMKAESEHTPSKREQMKIVKDHLLENPKYYTLLKKAGLKYGGKVGKENLVRDSKSGNTPARDLNNYNDMLDVEADGEVGGDSGLFAKGGAIKPYDANTEGDSAGIMYAKGGAVNVTVDNWNDIPEEYKKIRLPKKIEWFSNPNDEGLYEIVKLFLSKDELRPSLNGINFDDNGITVTNAHILLTIPTKTDYKGIYKKEKSGSVKIDYKYPLYQNIIPEERQKNTYFYIDVLKLLTYCKVAKNYCWNREITFKVNNSEMSFDADLMINFLTGLIKLTGRIYWFVSYFSNKQPLVFTENAEYKFREDIIGLIMPYINAKPNGYGAENEEKNSVLNVYFDFDDNVIRNADDSEVDLSVKTSKERAKRTPKTTTSTSTELPDFINISDSDKIKDLPQPLQDLIVYELILEGATEKIIELKLKNSTIDGAIDWVKSTDGLDFWINTNNGNLISFKKKYGKSGEKVSQLLAELKAKKSVTPAKETEKIEDEVTVFKLLPLDKDFTLISGYSIFGGQELVEYLNFSHQNNPEILSFAFFPIDTSENELQTIYFENKVWTLDELKPYIKRKHISGKYNWDEFLNYGKQTSTSVEQPKPSKTEKPKRNFELERKYLSQRISELAKELDLKKPILSNEEIAFYQREINSFILKLRKVNDAEMSLKSIEERVRGVYGLKISSFESEYPETNMTSINGLKSQLTEKEYFNVRTPEFKSFFGDWETAYLTDSYSGVSKVINPITKEPQPVFHGTDVLFVNWKTYETNNAHYFAVKREFSEFFATTWETRTDKAGVDSKVLKKLNPNRGNFLLRCFIDVKNPIDFSRFGVDKYPIREFLTFLKVNYNIGDFDFWTNITSHSGITQNTEVFAWQIIRLWQSFTKYVKVFTTYDGYIFYEYIPTKTYGGLENASLSYCAFDSNQIKFTDAYEFNALSNDSRFDLGGIL